MTCSLIYSWWPNSSSSLLKILPITSFAFVKDYNLKCIFSLDPTSTYGEKYYYLILQVRKLKAQWGKVISPGSHSLAVAEAPGILIPSSMLSP